MIFITWILQEYSFYATNIVIFQSQESLNSKFIKFYDIILQESLDNP